MFDTKDLINARLESIKAQLKNIAKNIGKNIRSSNQ